MEIKFNKIFSITFIILLIFTYFLGYTFLDFIDSLKNQRINPDFLSSKSIYAYLSFSLPNFYHLIVGIWLFLMAPKFKMEKLSWMLIGMVFGGISLVFFALLLIINKIKSEVDLNKTLLPLLILLSISFFINPVLSFLQEQFAAKMIVVEDYSNMIGYISTLSIVYYAIMLFFNTLFAIKLYHQARREQIKGKLVWAISALILGLLPVILFNEGLFIKTDYTLETPKSSSPKNQTA